MDNPELGKLVQFAYDLRKDEYKDWIVFPTYSFYAGCYMDRGIKTENGGIFVWRSYDNHSSCDVSTLVGIFEGCDNNPTKAYMLGTNTRDLKATATPLVLNEKTGCFDYADGWYKFSEKENLQFFIDAMVMVGFREYDILSVIKGTMTAEEAFMNVASDNIKNRRWVSFNRKYFEFDGNVAIKGDFGGIHLDQFPFPFSGQPLLDCSKVKISGAFFDENKNRVKLVNLGEAPKDAIRFTNLRTVLIDDVIDLSKLDATWTEFGHHTIINLDKSIARLDGINFALAVNEEGKHFQTDKDGHLLGLEVLDNDFTERDKKKIKVYASAHSKEDAMEARAKDADGIGLVRTEDIYGAETINELREFLECIDKGHYDDKEELNSFIELLREQLENILYANGSKRLIVRLFDFKLKEFLMLSGIDLNNIISRGSSFLKFYGEISKEQLKIIFNSMRKFGVKIDILIPKVENPYDFLDLKNEILKLSKNYGFFDIRVGAMVEDKYVAITDIEKIADYADFISIGTNDLTESVTGLSRQTGAESFRILTDEVKTIIRDVIYRARLVKPEIEIGICGEHSSYTENILFYRDLNIDYVATNAAFIEMNKSLLNDRERMQEIKIRTRKNK